MDYFNMEALKTIKVFTETTMEVRTKTDELCKQTLNYVADKMIEIDGDIISLCESIPPELAFDIGALSSKEYSIDYGRRSTNGFFTIDTFSWCLKFSDGTEINRSTYNKGKFGRGLVSCLIKNWDDILTQFIINLQENVMQIDEFADKEYREAKTRYDELTGGVE